MENPEYTLLFFLIVEREREIYRANLAKDKKDDPEVKQALRLFKIRPAEPYTLKELMLQAKPEITILEKAPKQELSYMKEERLKKLTDEYKSFRAKINRLERDEIITSYKTSNRGKQGRSRRIQLHPLFQKDEALLSYLFRIFFIYLQHSLLKEATIKDVMFSYKYARAISGVQTRKNRALQDDQPKTMRAWIRRLMRKPFMDHSQMNNIILSLEESRVLATMKQELIPYLVDSALEAIKKPSLTTVSFIMIGTETGLGYRERMEKISP